MTERAAGNGQRATGNGQRATGSGQRATGSGERAAGSGQRATGSGQPDELPPEIRQALERLDVKARAAAERVDVRRVTDGVLSDLKAGQGGTGARGHWKAAWLRVAAAAALLIGGAATAVMMTKGESGLPLSLSLDSQMVADSQAVMLAVETAADTAAVAISVVTVDDLNEQELRALLQAMENEESL